MGNICPSIHVSHFSGSVLKDELLGDENIGRVTGKKVPAAVQRNVTTV